MESNIVQRLETPNFLLIKEDRLYGRTTGVHPIVRKDFFGLSYDKSKLMSQKDSNSVLNRKLLASRVFGNKDLLSELNSIMHPRILEMCESAAEFPCVLDAPQLFESGGERLCARVLSVTAPEELRLKRIMKRDGITPEQAAQRMNAQYSEEFFKENSDFTVINDGRDIISQLKLFKEELL